MSEEKTRQLKIKINIAYFIAKEEAFVKFGPLIRLHHKNGVNINPTYDNDIRCAEMVGQIAVIMRQSLSAKLIAMKYLAVLIDRDTDISNTECEFVYVRLLEDGKPVNLLVGHTPMPLVFWIATKAAFRALCPEEDGGWMKKCISFGADGASVNMGHCGGVIAHLQREAERHKIPICCMPHRKSQRCLVYDLLHLIWKMYHFSGKSKQELYGLGQELSVDICTPSSVEGTHWIPHVHRALKVFLRHGQDMDLATDEGQYSIVLQHMEHLAIASTTAEVQGRAKKIGVQHGCDPGRVAGAENPGQPQFQGQVLQWPVGDHVDKGPIQARLQGAHVLLGKEVSVEP
ncbi:Zinc finger protein 862 [Merluccius polli]|uniref:Zinc finger protein 862 n=1 Tax=Merluccius polli TaxID=89951 RepID=A0AA47MUS7_MERPO|nr:Zinc finger protein 862 [Merluccius polli]